VEEGEDQALTTPLSFTGSAEELDSQLGRHLASYVDSHLALGSALAEAKAEMDAAAKAASEFTHPSGAVRLTTHPGGFLGLWSSLAGRKQFPMKFLADSKQTLQESVARRGEG
jgi:hypothetical protein